VADKEDPQYPVGYKKPPRHTQFKPGMSGNAKGRPKGAKNFATVIEKELRARIEVTENGKRKRISKREAIAKQTVNRAAVGDPKATSTLLNEARFQESQNQLPITQTPVTGPEDQMVMDNILQRIRLSQPFYLDPESPSEEPSEDESSTSIEPNEGEL
jgi:Family of unknown function (DUF5681)